MKITRSLVALAIFCSCSNARVSPPRFENAGATPREVVMKWVELYGKDVRVGLLTTERFRNGMHWREWAYEIQSHLQEIKYQHLGGEVVGEIISGEVATITLQARIAAIDGVSLQKEIYTLKRLEGRWLIDSLEVTDEVITGGRIFYEI